MGTGTTSVMPLFRRRADDVGLMELGVRQKEVSQGELDSGHPCRPVLDGLRLSALVDLYFHL